MILNSLLFAGSVHHRTTQCILYEFIISLCYVPTRPRVTPIIIYEIVVWYTYNIILWFSGRSTADHNTANGVRVLSAIAHTQVQYTCLYNIFHVFVKARHIEKVEQLHMYHTQELGNLQISEIHDPTVQSHFLQIEFENIYGVVSNIANQVIECTLILGTHNMCIL